MENKNELFSALTKAQSEMPVAGMTSNNPFFKSKYADLTELVKASRPVLTKNGLCVTQYLENKVDGAYLVTLLGHSSGQCIESAVKMSPAKADIQSFGSYMSYMMRYTYKAMVGIVTTEEEDDGEVTMTRITKPNEYKSDKISQEQLEILDSELEMIPELVQDILIKLNLNQLSDIPKNQFIVILKRIREIKQAKGVK